MVITTRTNKSENQYPLPEFYWCLGKDHCPTSTGEFFSGGVPQGLWGNGNAIQGLQGKVQELDGKILYFVLKSECYLLSQQNLKSLMNWQPESVINSSWTFQRLRSCVNNVNLRSFYLICCLTDHKSLCTGAVLFYPFKPFICVLYIVIQIVIYLVCCEINNLRFVFTVWITLV